MATERDYAVELNSFLQEHPTGNLTSFFHYTMTREGSDDEAIHVARAMFHDTSYGEGRGRRIAIAKREAARQALEYFHVNGVPNRQPEGLAS